jgi:ABC-type uncharacterized transport system substrate-binding protein
VDRYFIADGGLTSYVANLIGPYRRVASYVDRIFNGEKPADLLVINLETAKVLGPARAIGLQIQVLNASTSREIETAFATLVRDRADALFVAPTDSLEGASNLPF